MSGGSSTEQAHRQVIEGREIGLPPEVVTGTMPTNSALSPMTGLIALQQVRATRLPIAVRCGGHNVAGNSVVDGGIDDLDIAVSS